MRLPISDPLGILNAMHEMGQVGSSIGRGVGRGYRWWEDVEAARNRHMHWQLEGHNKPDRSWMDVIQGIPIPFRDIELPGDQYVKDQLHEAMNILAPPLEPNQQALMVDPMGEGSLLARLIGLANATKGGRYRVAPTRSKGEAMKVAMLKKLYQSTMRDTRGVRSLPELSPGREGFRQYEMRTRPSPEARRPELAEGRARSRDFGDVNLSVKEQMEGEAEHLRQLYPHPLAREMNEYLTIASKDRIERLFDEAFARKQAGQRLTPDDIEGLRGDVSEIIGMEAALNRDVARSSIGRGGDRESALELMRNAARLAVLQLRYERDPNTLLEQQARFADWTLGSGPKRAYPKPLGRTQHGDWLETFEKGYRIPAREYIREYRDLRRKSRGYGDFRTPGR